MMRPAACLFVLVSLANCSTISQPLTIPVTLGAAPSAAPADEITERPQRVIVMIGDGLGIGHLTALSLATRDRGGSAIEALPVVGLVRTSSATHVVTDSGAAATAFATGQRTRNRAVSMTTEGERMETLMQLARQEGWRTGIVTTASIVDATPAAFVAHARNRYTGKRSIARQMIESQTEVLIGAGNRHFDDELLSDASNLGYTLVTEPHELDDAEGERLLALLPGARHDMDFTDAPLHRLTSLALERLGRSDEPFLLLVEHEGTDSAAHQQLPRETLEATISFDRAVAAALEFADRQRGTLVVVLSDHETGGVRISGTEGTMQMEVTTGSHTAGHVPLFAKGPGATRFAGVKDNDEIGRILKMLIAR